MISKSYYIQKIVNGLLLLLYIDLKYLPVIIKTLTPKTKTQFLKKQICPKGDLVMKKKTFLDLCSMGDFETAILIIDENKSLLDDPKLINTAIAFANHFGNEKFVLYIHNLGFDI